MGEEDAAAGECAPEEVVGGEEAGGVHGVAEGDVDEDALHDDEDGGAVDGDADGGDDPADGLAGGPGEEEEADGGTEGGDEGRDEAVLLGAHAVLHQARVGIVVEVADVDADADEAGDEDAEEDEADLAEVEAVVDRVDEGEDLEEGVVDAVDDGGVDLDEHDGRVLEGDLEGLDEGVDEDVGDLHVALVDLALGHETLVAGELAEAAGALEEDGVAAGLGEEEEHEDEDRGGGPDGLVEGPPPALDGDGEAGKERTKGRCGRGERRSVS